MNLTIQHEREGNAAKSPRPPKGGVAGRDCPAVYNAADIKCFPRLWRRAVRMRHEPTLAESKMWELLRGKRLGYKFRRQHPIEKYIVDFYCPEKGLVIEVDGGIHELLKERDIARDVILRKRGCRIFRVSNDRVLYETELVLAEILEALQCL